MNHLTRTLADDLDHASALLSRRDVTPEEAGHAGTKVCHIVGTLIDLGVQLPPTATLGDYAMAARNLFS